MVEYLDTSVGHRLAYHKTDGDGPGIVFLGGFMSDMSGTKAVFLEDWAKKQGRAFLRFDYTGHGQSSGRFEDGCIGDWTEDALEALSKLTSGPQILVGSSMGGWIALLLARSVPKRVHALIGIAAAPDFTEDSMWPGLSDAQRAEILEQGQTSVPNAYDDTPYILTRRLFEDGKMQLVLRTALNLPFPVRLMQGTDDEAVETSVPLRLLDHATCPDMRLTLVKDADHRFSTPDCLAMITSAIAETSR
ncbi:alpha/beta hydrolase [Roseinatronobacter monicus]|uniref:Palmitoyl-protein thioesterase ABHD10, mitochondrial n=1 Tax=Roseinatronobacter monicus TaxID=393481 RepID=A0A543KCP3_9RHOB|nr:alpha/beta hydrolase [Roseinatronobacter monicus]TQM92824.1 pimeloyl-ACP methyl ester carboxylesterase [Roseinatronobacter monicus]